MRALSSEVLDVLGVAKVVSYAKASLYSVADGVCSLKEHAEVYSFVFAESTVPKRSWKIDCLTRKFSST